MTNIKINGKDHKILEIKKDEKVLSVISELDIPIDKIIAAKQDNQYINLNEKVNSCNCIDFITVTSDEGNQIYKDTAIFILCFAFNRVFPEQELVIEHSIGDGVYAEIIDYTFTEQEILDLGEEFNNITEKKLPIYKKFFEPDEAKKIAEKMNRKDIQKNIKYEKMKFYECDEYYDYFVGQLAHNTGIIKAFELTYNSPGLILRFPTAGKDTVKKEFSFPRMLFKTHQEHDKWLNILSLHNVSALNEAVQNYKIKDLIQIEEALHEKKIIAIANDISQRKVIKLVLVAGPSSSGKTTFAKRLSVQLRVNGIIPKIISMDDYFLPRDRTPRKANGEYDFESIRALDLELLNEHLTKVLQGKMIELPKFNFVNGMREENYSNLKLEENELIIMEGIHGLNKTLTSSVPFNQKIMIYVSALNNLNIDSHNRIPTTDSRKFRRIVRDYKYRGHSPENTLNSWRSVRAGEEKNIFPFQENADFMFNSSLTYELGVLKKYIMPLMKKISNRCSVFMEAQRLQSILEHIENIQDDLVPSNSILREFIGGSIFNY